MAKIVYMIQRKSDGLYSTGGMSPSFNKNGKTWSGIGPLKLHLNQFIDHKGERTKWNRDVYKGCHIIQFEQVILVKNPVNLSIEDFLEQRAEKVQKEIKERKQKWLEYQKANLQKQLDELDK